MIILAALAAPALVYGIVHQTTGRGRWRLILLTVPIAALVVAGGPWMLGIGAICAALGWSSTSRD